MSIGSSDSEAEYHSYSERTLAIIKPEAYEDSEAIENHIRKHGFSILARREVRLTPEQAAELYRGHYGRHHFPHLVAQMSSGPIVAMVLACRGCIQKWLTLMGPARHQIRPLTPKVIQVDTQGSTGDYIDVKKMEVWKLVVEAQAYWPHSLRACYGRRTKYGDYFNALHGSRDHAEALREIHFFFPNMIVGPLLRQWQVGDYIQKHLAPTLEPALSALARERPDEPILWLAQYLQKNNPNEPQLGPATHEARDDPRCHTPEPSGTYERK